MARSTQGRCPHEKRARAENGSQSQMMFANLSRDELRGLYRAAWRKFRLQQTLTPLDKQIVAVISEHPEYHVIIESAADDLANYSPRSGQLNPWLHMGLHLE